MGTASVDHQRLDLAGTRDFTKPGAGVARRERLAAYSRQWLGELWDQAAAPLGDQGNGIALAAVGSLCNLAVPAAHDADGALNEASRGVKCR